MNIQSKNPQLILTYDINPLIGARELDALDRFIERALRVMEHGARDKGYNGAFHQQGYSLQIEHAEDHLRARGRIDPGSGEDELVHAGVRIIYAVDEKYHHETGDTEPCEPPAETLTSSQLSGGT